MDAVLQEPSPIRHPSRAYLQQLGQLHPGQLHPDVYTRRLPGEHQIGWHLLSNCSFAKLITRNGFSHRLTVFVRVFPPQNGIYSAVPFVLMFVIAISASQFADYLRLNKILSTVQTRKIFQTVGSCRARVSNCSNE